MESYQIIAGFSDIKSELLNKTGNLKSMAELKLWFSFEDGVLYAHDYSEQNKCLSLAFYNQKNKRWLVTFRRDRYGRKLVEWIIDKEELSKVSKELNDQYELHGFSELSRR